MKALELVQILEAKVHTPIPPELEVKSACGADLMSDVMAFVKEDVVLLTGLVNIQTVRTAHLLDIPLVIFVRGKEPNADMIREAVASGIGLATTETTLFVACGKLFEAGLRRGGARVGE